MTVEREELGRRWEVFAEQECRGYSPLYESICRSVAADDDLLALVESGPRSAHQPNVLLASVHYLLLGGVDHPLADVYAGTSREDAAPLFRDFCLTRRDDVVALLATRHTQTNECGRSAAIVPALTWVARDLREPLALVDVGASAGLNLLCDQYRIDYGPAGAIGPPDSPVRIDCRVLGGSPPVAARPLKLAARLGLDREPLDLDDPDATRWLLACVWPDTGRLDRTTAAIDLARARKPVVVEGDAVDDLAGVLARLPDDATPCITTTWSFAYLSLEQRHAFTEQLTRLATDRPLAWISAEGPGIVDRFELGEPPEHDLTTPSVLGVEVFDGRRRRPTLLAWVHPHGHWIDWRAEPSS